jgi:outer membrane lipoprotein-sorting protein
MKQWFFLFFLFFSSATIATISNKNMDIRKLLQRVDQLFRGNSSYAELEMVVETPYWKRKMEMKVWTRGMDYTLVKILSPKKDKGIATLKRKQEIWNYFPKINRIIKVPPSMMMSSWMGSDFTNDDLVKETTLLDDYSGKYVNGEKMKEFYYVELVPYEKTVTVWGKILIVVRKSDLMPTKEVYFDEKNRKVRVMELLNIKKFGDRMMPSEIILTPLLKKGNLTKLIYKNAKFNIKIDDSFFNRKVLRN